MVPRSVSHTWSLPDSRILSGVPHGCRCHELPFFTLTVRPVWAAATSKSVWRQRNAGIEHVGHFGRHGRFFGKVDVCHDTDTKVALTCPSTSRASRSPIR